jgi:hypothetical protein
MNKKKTEQPKSLKSQNQRALIGALSANLSVLAFALTVRAVDFSSWKVDLAKLAPVLPAAALTVLCGVLLDQLSPIQKARVVFLRWRNPLPGSRAFTEIAAADPRISMEALRVRLGPLPTEPQAQNVLWYATFKKLQELPSIIDSHRAYLFNRDFLTLIVLIAPVGISLAAFFARPWYVAAVYYLIMVGEFLVVRNAAEQAARRFVANVLAEAQSEPDRP